MDTCTWLACTAKAEHPQKGANGKRWANLCAIHDVTLRFALANPDQAVLMKAWVNARGGPDKVKDTFGAAVREPTGETL